MTKLNYLFPSLPSLTITSALLVAALTVPASAASLFVTKGATQASDENACLGFALDAATHLQLQRVQHNKVLVSGAQGDKFIVMMCVGNVVVISVAGDHPAELQPLAHALFDHIINIKTL